MQQPMQPMQEMPYQMQQPMQPMQEMPYQMQQPMQPMQEMPYQMQQPMPSMPPAQPMQFFGVPCGWMPIYDADCFQFVHPAQMNQPVPYPAQQLPVETEASSMMPNMPIMPNRPMQSESSSMMPNMLMPNMPMPNIHM